MPVGPHRTKEQKAEVVKTEMHKFGKGKLHSGSTNGPVVTNPEQAIAISMSESGQSKKPKKGGAEQPHPKTNPGEYDTEPHDAGCVTAAMPGKSEEQKRGGEPHTFRHQNAPGAHGYGHSATQRSGALRNSGHSGAHRIGKR